MKKIYNSGCNNFFAILYCIKNETQKHLMEIVKLCKIARRQQQ